MNFGSYNYLGFAENKELCAAQVQKTTGKYGVGVCASRQELGIHYMYFCLLYLVVQMIPKDIMPKYYSWISISRKFIKKIDLVLDLMLITLLEFYEILY